MKNNKILFIGIILIIVNVVIIFSSFVVYSDALNACDTGAVEYDICFSKQLTTARIMLSMYFVLILQIVLQIIIFILYIIKKVKARNKSSKTIC